VLLNQSIAIKYYIVSKSYIVIVIIERNVRSLDVIVRFCGSLERTSLLVRFCRSLDQKLARAFLRKLGANKLARAFLWRLGANKLAFLLGGRFAHPVSGRCPALQRSKYCRRLPTQRKACGVQHGPYKDTPANVVRNANPTAEKC
jgi:hypothetical protein